MAKQVKTRIIITDDRLKAEGLAYAHASDAAFDLRACFKAGDPNTKTSLKKGITYMEIQPGKSIIVPAGFKIEVPAGYMAMAVPRSGLGSKDGLVLGNLVGVIDVGYQGEVMLCLWNRNTSKTLCIDEMARVAQMVIVPVARASFDVVSSFDVDTDRGTAGLGSSGVA